LSRPPPSSMSTWRTCTSASPLSERHVQSALGWRHT
jgi:hypothetical protein